MKYCPYCGAELIPGALSFCSECGKALPVPAERTMPQDQAPPSLTSRTWTTMAITTMFPLWTWAVRGRRQTHSWFSGCAGFSLWWFW